MAPEAREARVAVLNRNKRVFSPEEASVQAKAAWGRPGYHANQVAKHKGQVVSPETRALLSERRRGKPRPASFGPKVAAKARQRWAGYSLKQKADILQNAWHAMRGARPSRLERTVRAFLTEKGIEFLADQVIGRYHPDILLPPDRIIECDGWPHTLPKQQAFDHQRDDFLQAQGYRMLRLTQAEIDDGNYQGKVLAWL